MKPLNTSEDKLMFGIMVNDVNVGDPANPGINMKPSSYFFHFNNGYPHVNNSFRRKKFFGIF